MEEFSMEDFNLITDEGNWAESLRKRGERQRKAIIVFRNAHRGEEWSIVPNVPHCPTCLRTSGKRRPYCRQHRWAYEGWLSSLAMVTQLAQRAPRLKDELKKAGLWFE
jgi:hypothetical protein